MLSPLNTIFTTHLGQAGGRGLSPRIWNHMRGQNLSPDGLSNGFEFFDDFVNHGAIAAAANDVSGGYAAYIDTSNTINALATEPGGVVQFSTDATDNDECWLTTGGNTGVLGKISDTSGDEKLTLFECRFRVDQVADNEGAIFIGLAEEGLAAADTKVDNTGVMADKDFIGFNTVHADGDALRIDYKKEGETQQNVQSSVLAADTWYKVGMVYNPRADSSKRISFFIDNVEQSSYVTATNIAASTFPDAEELAILIGMKNGAATACELDIDWVAFWQEG